MLRRNGTIILQGRSGDDVPAQKPEEVIAFEIEQYLNDKVALDIFKKFGILIRVHLK